MFGFTVGAQGGCQGRQRVRGSHGEYCQGKHPNPAARPGKQQPESEQLFVLSEDAAVAARETAAGTTAPLAWSRCSLMLTRTIIRFIPKKQPGRPGHSRSSLAGTAAQEA